MLVPFSFRKIPPYEYEGDGRFPHHRIKKKDKKIMRKKQLKRYANLIGKDWN